MDISLVIPLYNEELSLVKLYQWIERVMIAHGFSYEVIFIDDGSTDNSWQVIENLKSSHGDVVRGIKFRNNYGKSPALYCGFQQAEGEVVITLDADLQDSPDEIPELYRMIVDDGYDLVSGWKRKRYDAKITKKLPSRIYNATARKVTGLKLHDMNSGIKAYRREVVKSIEVYGEMHRYIPYLAKNAGFTKIAEKVVEHRKREFGQTKFGLNRFVNGYLDLITLWFFNRFGKKPMHFFGLWGSAMFILGFIALIVLIIWKLIELHRGNYGSLIAENPYFFLAMFGMILGSMFFLAGFVGEMIARNSPERNNYSIEKKL